MTYYPTLHDEMRAVVANLESREWIQDDMQNGAAVCAHGAVMTCQGLRPGDKWIIRAVMRTKGVTEGWNDEPGRTKEEVLQALSSIHVTDDDLAATFGPQWRRVVGVIWRAAVLTGQEAERLAAARAATRDATWAAARAAARDATWAAAQAATRAAARAAARDAARAAARDAAQAAAWDATWAAAWDATWDATRAAAWATCVADLVGQNGLTQQHIDTLMRPWVTALGADWDAEVTA